MSVQADCDVEQAYVRMSDRAAVAHVSLDEIAKGVIDRSIRFGDT